MSDKIRVEPNEGSRHTENMKEIKDNEIYPKFEFRLSQEDKEWLKQEVKDFHDKFNEGEARDFPAISKSTLIVSVLRHGLRYLREREKLSSQSCEVGND